MQVAWSEGSFVTSPRARPPPPTLWTLVAVISRVILVRHQHHGSYPPLGIIKVASSFRESYIDSGEDRNFALINIVRITRID